MHTKHIADAKCSNQIAIVGGLLLCFTAACSRLTRYGMYPSSSAQVAEIEQRSNPYSAVTRDNETTLPEWEKSFKRLEPWLRDYKDQAKNDKIALKEIVLHCVVLARDQEKLKCLLELCRYNAININATIFGITPLHLAIYEGFDEAIPLLIASGADATCRMEKYGIQPIHIAASCGSLSSIKLLIEAGASIEAIDVSGKTPLHWVASRGHTSCFRELFSKLLDKGSFPSSQDDMGDTPFHAAVRNRHSEMVSELLCNVAIRLMPWINKKDKEGNTPLHTAVDNDDIEMVEALLTVSSIRSDEKNKEGLTAFEVAVQQGNKPMLQAFKNRGW